MFTYIKIKDDWALEIWPNETVLVHKVEECFINSSAGYGYASAYEHECSKCYTKATKEILIKAKLLGWAK